VPWLPAVASASRDVICSRLQDTRFRTTAAAVVGGLAVAPVAVWVTVVIAHSGPPHDVANAGLAAPVSPSATATRTVYVPRPAYHPHPVVSHKAGHVNNASPASTGSASGDGAVSAFSNSSSASGSGTSSWEAPAASYGVPNWALKMASSYMPSGS
jgi:hypothetical protein